MELDFAFFADAAHMHEDGLFSVLRGGIDFIPARAFPATQGVLVLIVRLRTRPEEWNRNHELLVQIVGPNGEALASSITNVPFVPPPNVRHPDRTNVMTFSLNYFNNTFPEAGDYTFRFSVDGVPIGSTVLALVRSEEAG
jgi:hypothetical protein